jgi:hypothetical protein
MLDTQTVGERVATSALNHSPNSPQQRRCYRSRWARPAAFGSFWIDGHFAGCRFRDHHDLHRLTGLNHRARGC